MGGGDLNLKKSWHPSTMKNMEKVWKAEQQKDQEKKRIEILRREIEMEKDREDLTNYAMEQGVIEKDSPQKKELKKLDWMYKNKHEMVNREEYLLGRPIDKSFEQLAQAEKDTELNRAPKNHVEYECIPPSLRFFSGNEQVDLVRKMQEDPLYAIKKKEMETRSQLLKNPVKLKQLKELLEQQSKKDKIDKKNKKKKSKNKHKSDNSDNETELDNLLAEKYKKLKDKISEKELMKSMRKLKKKRKKKHSKDSSSDSESSSDESDEEIKMKHQKKRRRSSSREAVVDHDKNSVKKESGRFDRQRNSRIDNYRKYNERMPNRDRYDNSDHKRNEKSYRYSREENYHKNSRYRENGSYRYNQNSDDKYTRTKSHTSTVTQDKSPTQSKTSSNEKWVPRKKSQLTEEEKEKRRQEMMANAVWRDKEREQNVKQYREEDKKEQTDNKLGNKDFIRKQLVVATEKSTVASRIKSNINNIQRSGRAMDTNFAKR